ncbi:MAG TPA: glycosyltransferase family 4 protein [Candidatus Acidoferrales bacterium]|nr:glycosyltransferase family 4 protein [Candidatus Acidoferrales bacterium]
MTILFLDQFSDLGGAQQVLLEFLPAIRQRGWHALVGLPGDGPLFTAVRALGIETARIDCGPYSSGQKSAADLGRFVAGTPRLAHQIRALARRAGAQIIYLNGPRLVPAAALAGLDHPVVFHSHSYLAHGITRRFTGAALRKMNARVIAACAFVAEPWRRYVDAARIRVIYNGVAGPAQAPKRSTGNAPRIGCIGRLAPEKGQLDFVAAASLIHRALPGARFVIHGAALFHNAASGRYEARVRRAAAGLPVEFAGWTADVHSAMASLDLLLVPSARLEATTRVILESFAAGLPVIAFRSGGIPEVVEHGINGLLVDSAEEMARESIRLLTAGSALAGAISRAARDTWERRFTIARFHDEIARVLISIHPTSAGMRNAG